MILCWIGIHRKVWRFVGNSDSPDAYIRACTRCGREIW